MNSLLLDPLHTLPYFAGLLPFDTFLKQQLRLMKKVNTPRPKDDQKVVRRYTEWRVGDKCLIDYTPHRLTRGYNVKRGRVMSIGRIYTNTHPYVFRLKDSKGHWEPGYYRPEVNSCSFWIGHIDLFPF